MLDTRNQLRDKPWKTDNKGLHVYHGHRFSYFGSQTEPPFRNSAVIAKEEVVAV
jgi:hypothetical protein